MTSDEFRALALALPDAEEREHMGHPDFRVGNKIFATLSEDETSGVVRLTLDQQEELVGDGGGPFEALGGTWGMQGWTRVRLAKAREDGVRRALRMAWEGLAPKNKRPGPRRGSTPRGGRGRWQMGRGQMADGQIADGQRAEGRWAEGRSQMGRGQIADGQMA